MGHVLHHEADLEAQLAQARFLRLAGGGIDIGDHHFGAFLQQGFGGSQAQATGASGDDTDFVLYSFHGFIPVLFMSDSICRIASRGNDEV